ncbi:hypothetical protein LTR17_016878 [Elasticomyces elasticus]|nr:hypothetical protein LTR17_016878 [Elasticomyces elasticus]
MEEPQSRPKRLIATKTMVLMDEPPADLPYAILSHTWGEGEVLYQDWSNGDREKKLGWPKIMGACVQAVKNGVEYIWVDCACIDKSNSTELSEAINSMFAWYQGAAVCYVHMADVTILSAWWDDREAEDLEIKRLAETFSMRPTVKFDSTILMNRWDPPVPAPPVSFSNSRYFRRGWTLQEMLAPRSVHFYAYDWQFLGALYPMRLVVADITGIPAVVLGREVALEDCSIAQRLSWAAERETQKVEDMAYALLGILGVHLSLNYGEGMHAFVRLQEEILNRVDELSVLAWGIAEPHRRSALLATSPADFKDCGDVVVNSTTKCPEHWMTSRGLKGTFELTHHEAEDGCMDFFLSLHCHLGTIDRYHAWRPLLQAASAAVVSPLNILMGDDPFRLFEMTSTLSLVLRTVPQVSAQQQRSLLHGKSACRTDMAFSVWGQEIAVRQKVGSGTRNRRLHKRFQRQVSGMPPGASELLKFEGTIRWRDQTMPPIQLYPDESPDGASRSTERQRDHEVLVYQAELAGQLLYLGLQ